MVKTKNGYKISFLIVLSIVVLSFCIFVGSITAWLRVDYTRSSEGLELGTVQLELYNGATKIEATRVQNGSVVSTHATVKIDRSNNVTRLIGVTVRNTGTIDCLVRAQFNIYYYEDDGDRVTILLSNTASTASNLNYASIDHSDWIAKLPNNNVAFGELYYNEKLSPYVLSTIDNDGNITTNTVTSNAINIIKSITTVDGEKNRDYYMDITIDGVAYSGNIYKKIENGETTNSDIPVTAYPFGSKETLPTDWNAYK